MKYSNTIEYNIATKLDSSGLTKMQNQIREIELSLQRMGDKQGGFLAGQVEQARKELQGLNKALTEAFNPSLGIIDISKFRTELAKGKIDSEGLASAFRLAGTDGQVAFNNLISQLGTFDAGIQRTSSAVDKMWTTFQNTFRWGFISSFFSQFMNAIHSSIDYVKELDDSLTQIMLVTDYNRDSMNQFAKSANEAAKAVSMTTTGMTNASLIFAQQGYDLGQSQELATLSAKLANASQQDTATTSDQITAYMNAYGLENSISELTQAMDNWALIANVSAADVGELAQASQRAASMANAVGVSGEQLASQIATIESVTREAPEQIGNGLKTLYARFSDIAAGGEDEDGFTLGKVTSQLQAIGVQIFDQMGNIRDVGDIMEDLMVIWDDLDQTSRVAASQALAGKYQVNRFMALMDNSEMYRDYLGATGTAATGTLDQMNEEYANSIAGRTAKMQATLEGIFSSIFNTDAVYPFVDAMQTFLDLTQKFIEAVGGGGPVITGVIALIGRLFSKNIANAFVDTKINNNLSKIQAENYKNAPAAIAQLRLSNPNPENQNTKALLDFAQKGAEMAPNMSEQGLENYNRLLKENTQLSNQATEAQQNFEDVISKVNAELGINLGAKDSITKDESGLNVTPLLDVLQQASNNEEFGQSGEYWDNASKAVDSYAKKLAEVHRELAEYRKIENPSQDATDKVKQKIQELKAQIDALRGTSVQSSESIDQIEQTIDLLNGTLDETDKQTDDWKESLRDSSAEIERLQSNAGTLIKILEALSKTGGLKDKSGIEALLNELYAAQSKVAATQGAAQGGQRQMTSFISDTEDVIKIKNIVDTTSAIGELAFAWQSFQHLGSLWSDENLSNGEKLLQTIINITMAMSQLMPVMDKLNLGKKITGLFSSNETKNSLETVKAEISEITNKITKQKEILNSINKATKDSEIAEEALKVLEDERNAKIVQRQILEKQTTAELAKQKMMSAALNIGLGIALAAIAAGIGAIQEQERQRIQDITDNAENSRSILDAVDSSEFFEKWDIFKENGELTDELKESMAALAQQVGINIEAQDIYAGNIEQLNDKIRDNIELEKERARTNFEVENKEFETQLNRNAIQAAQVSGTITTAAGTFNSAVDYAGQAGAVKDLSERLGDVADAQSKVTAARKEFGKDSLEYNSALREYEKLRDQLKDEDIDIEKAQNNFKQLANLAIEEFKAGRDSQDINAADWVGFLNTDEYVQDYMNSLGEEAALQFKLGLLSQFDSDNPIYSMITAPGQIDFSKGNLSTTESTEWDFSNLMQSGIDPSELLGAEAGTKTWKDFAQAFIDAANNDTITINPNIKLENKYDFDSDEEINKYLEDYTNIDRATLDTAAELRMGNANQENNYEGYNKYNGEAEYQQSQIESIQQDIDNSTNIRDTRKATEELIEAQDKYNEALEQTQEDQKLYEKALQRAAAASARMSKTLDEMNDHFDDNKEILKEGNKTTAEYAEALTETKQDLAGLLDVDLESIPNSLAQNPKILEDMNTLLHGTQEEAEAAYKEIQNIAAGEIIDNLDIPVGLTDSDGNEITPEQIQSTLHGLIDSLNAQDLSIDMEADINTDEWYARVNELLASGAITAEQLTQVLSSAGYEGEFSTQPGRGWAQEMSYDLEVTGFDVPEINGPTDLNKLAGMSGHIKMTPTASKTVPIETQVPVLKGATQKGGFVNNAGGSGGRRSGGGGGGGGRSCFVAGTLITTNASFKPIEQVQKGDIVLSYNERLGLNEYSEVLQTMIHNTIEPIYTLYIKDEQLRVTGIHRFLVTNKITCGVPQWVHAADLRVGQWVLFADGTWHVIHKIEINIEHQIVYNFEVSHNHNYYVGRNQILAHNKGGGGGGGKKPKTIEPKEKKEHEKDYYEEVNSQLDKTEKILSRIEKEEDRLIGDKARANQNKQLSNLAKEIELQKEKQKIQQQELKDVDALMRKRTREAQKIAIDSGVGAAIPTAVYDEDGVIANYEQMSAAIDNVHNKLIDKYNAAAKAGNEELAKEIEKTIEKFDKYGEDLLNNAQRHNELQSEIEETTNALEELEDAMEDIRIEAFKAHQEAIDNLKDLREGAAELASLFRDFDEDGFLTRWSLDDTPIGDMVEAMYELDNIYTVTQEDANAFYQDIINKKRQDLANTTDPDERVAIQSAISYFQGQQANLSSTDTLQNGLLGLANQDLDMLRGWIEGTNSEPNPFGENEAALWEAYQEAYDRSIELFKDWRETVRDLRDSIIDTYDEQEEAIEQHIDEYDRLLDHLERTNDTYSLYYGEDSYDGILAIMDQQGSTMQQQLNSLTTAYNYWQEQYEAAVANGDEKLIQEIREKMEDAEDAMYDKAEELAEHWVERYETAVDASIQKVDFQLWGGGPGQMDFEDQTMIWELQKDYISTYKDDVERAYEVDKLRSKYINLLNDAQGMSLQIQNKIRGQMQEQLDLLQNQGTMSEYDVKLANAKLEILQKQIALEDAQRNKNKMQLRRDTQGNYRYVYTANQGDVQKAQDELNESQYDAYEMTKEQTIANNDRAVSLYQDYMEKLRNIANKYKDDEVARAAALKALNEEYSKLLGALEEDFKDTTNGMYDVLTWMVENGTQDTATAAMDMLDQLYDKNGEVKENTGNDWRDFATQITTNVLPNIEKAVQEGIANINAEASDLQTNMVGDNGVLTQIGSSTNELNEAMKRAKTTTEEWANATRNLFESFSPDNQKVQDAMTQLRQMEQQLSANQSATSALSERYTQANADLQASRAESQHYQTALDFATGARSIQAGNIIKLKKGTFVHYDRYGGYQQDEQGHTGWRLPKDMWVKFGRPISGVPLPYNFYATGESLKSFGDKKDPKSDQHGGVAKTDFRHHQQWWFDKKELQKNVLNAMDTGGYTGEWHDQTSLYKNGKVALLHQKELVLNAMDTENILAAVSLMRDITKGSMMGLSSSIGGFGTASSSYNPITEQRVEIQASFPNATDAEDIRQALIGLSDRAYQYAHRTI